jgi:hypothetical protein
MKKSTLILLLFAVVNAQQIVHTIDAPADGITGLAVNPSGSQNGELWAVSKTAPKVYKINSVTGEVLGSFPVKLDTSYYPQGLTVAGNIVYVAQWDGTIYGGWGYEYTYDGTFKGRTSIFC